MKTNKLEDITYCIANALEHWTTDRKKAKRYMEAALDKSRSKINEQVSRNILNHKRSPNMKTQYTGKLHNDLHILIPAMVADTVTAEPEHAQKLVELAQHFYAANHDWAKQITDTNKGRDTLKAFMEHWYQGFQLSGRWIDERKRVA